MYGNNGNGCKDCFVNTGVVSPDECIGCDGQTSCNDAYFPKTTIKIPTSKPKRKWFQVFIKKGKKIYTII
jgi:hypothetical protein